MADASGYVEWGAQGVRFTPRLEEAVREIARDEIKRELALRERDEPEQSTAEGER